MVHVGDITSGTGPCSDEWMEARRRQFARRRDGLVVLMQANPFVTRRFGADGYTEVRERLRRLGESMPGKVLLVHGDTHQYRDDEPLPGLRRVEVYGSPHIRWARARVERSGARLFSVELVPQ